MSTTTHSAEELNLRGIHLYQQGRFAESESAFEMATQLACNFAKAWNNRGLAARQLGRLQLSIQYFTRAIHSNPEESKFYANRAMVRKQVKDLEGALVDLTLALAYASTEDQKKWLLERAQIRRDLGMLEDAASDCDALLDMDLADADAYELRGRLYTELGQYAPALRDLNRALALCDAGKLPGVLHARAAVAVARKRFHEAMADYNRALAIDPSFTSAYIARGHAHYHLRNFRKAADDYQRAMKIDAQVTVHQLVRILRQHAIENPTETLENARKHLRLVPEDHIARLRLAITLWLLNSDSPEISEQFQVVAERDPELWAACQVLLDAVRSSGRLPSEFP